MEFPTVTGANLLRQKMTLPSDLKGDLNIVLIAFRQWQQMSVNTWLPAAKAIEKTFPGVQVYELPVIQPKNIIAQTFINEGMRAGIPNQTTRERTVTLYVDKQLFRRALNILDEDEITVLLLNRQGEVLWRDRGSYHPEKGASLIQTIRQMQRTLEPVYA